MNKHDTVTAEYIRQVLHYDPQTGEFVWIQHSWRPDLIGKKAGSGQSAGYWAIAIHNRKILAHRLAWLYMTGGWPEKHIDHIDGNKRNNRFDNLRDVSRFANLQNMRNATKANACGYLGVCRHGNKWIMQIMANGVRHRQGGFSTPEEAHQAYLEMKRKLHGGCTI